MTPPVFLLVGLAQAGEEVVLGGDEGRHAADVRRLRAGEPIDLTDGAGLLAHGVVAAVRRGELVVSVASQESVPVAVPRLSVVQALARGGRDEQAVESMTEIGVDHVIGWEAFHNVAHWTDRTQAKWSSTAQAAAKQSRRAWWPQISGPLATSAVAELCRTADLALVLHESAERSLSSVLGGLSEPAAISDVVVIVGPEGGITDDELSMLDEAGASVVRLGPTVLRSSTAGTVALAILAAHLRWR